MKTSLYREWLDLQRTNRSLERAGQPLIEITPPEQKYQLLIQTLARDTEMAFYEPDTKIVRQGYRETDFMYLISQGSCSVSIYDVNPQTNQLEDMYVRQLEASDFFGEISVVHDGVRTATVTCANYSTLGKISLETLYNICARYPFFKLALMKYIQTYDDQCIVFV